MDCHIFCVSAVSDGIRRSVRARNDTDLAVQVGPALFAGSRDGGLSLGADVLLRQGYLTGGIVGEAGNSLSWFGHQFTGVFGAAGGCLHWEHFRTRGVLLFGATRYTNPKDQVPENMRSGTVATVGGRVSGLWVIPFSWKNPTGMTLGPVAEVITDSKTRSVEVSDPIQGETGNATIGYRMWRVGLEIGLVFDL